MCIPKQRIQRQKSWGLHSDRKGAPPEGSVNQSQPVILEAIQGELAGKPVTLLPHLFATLRIRQKPHHLLPELPKIRAAQLASLAQQLSHASAAGADYRRLAEHCLVGVPAPTLIECRHGYRQSACFEQELVVANGEVLHIEIGRLINRRACSNEVNIETRQGAVSLVHTLSGSTSA